MRCLAYLRRSKKSDGRAVSLKAQEEAVRNYACLQGFTVVSVLCDDGISGGDNDRFKRIYSMLLHDDARAVVCYHVDRFSRDLAGFLSTLKQYSKEDIQLWVVDRGQIKADKSNDFLLLGVEGVVAQYQRMVSGEKTKAALKHLKTHGRRYSGYAPYGFEHVDGALLEVEEEQRILTFIDARRDWPARRLQRFLNQSESTKARGGKDWQASTVLNIQRRIDD